jgi:uncharacterized membrane protein YfcA
MLAILFTGVIGIIAGLVGGSVGTAGGSIMIPGLLIAGVVPDYKTAVGTVLLALVAPLSIGALIPFWKSKNVNVKVAVVLMLTTIVGAYFAGEFITKRVSNRLLLLLYGIYMLLMSGYFFYRYASSDKAAGALTPSYHQQR